LREYQRDDDPDAESGNDGSMWDQMASRHASPSLSWTVNSSRTCFLHSEQ
jgi:hypothetical protein